MDVCTAKICQMSDADREGSGDRQRLGKDSGKTREGLGKDSEKADRVRLLKTTRYLERRQKNSSAPSHLEGQQERSYKLPTMKAERKAVRTINSTVTLNNHKLPAIKA